MRNIFLIGMTNAGKSSLFNALTLVRTSVVDSTANLTRDVIKYSNDEINLFDTPGIKSPKDLNLIMNKVDRPDLICILIDPYDYSYELCTKIIQYFHGIECVIIINKSDTIRPGLSINFGNIEIFYVSAKTQENLGKLRNFIGLHHKNQALPSKNSDLMGSDMANQAKMKISWSMFGRANVGKSTLANLLLNYERFIVQDEVGTTREVHAEISQTLGCEVVDTPGYRKNNAIGPLEKASQYRLEQYLDKSTLSLALVLIDAAAGLLRTDRMILDKVMENFAVIIVVTKVDAVNDKLLKNILDEINRLYPRINYECISAKTKLGLASLKKRMQNMEKVLDFEISTGKLNKWLHNSLNLNMIKYMTCADPFKYIIFSKKRLGNSVLKQIENSFLEHFNLKGIRPHFEVRLDRESSLK